MQIFRKVCRYGSLLFAVKTYKTMPKTQTVHPCKVLLRVSWVPPDVADSVFVHICVCVRACMAHPDARHANRSGSGPGFQYIACLTLNLLQGFSWLSVYTALDLRYASINGSIYPSITFSRLPVSTFVLWSLTIRYGLKIYDLIWLPQAISC